MRQSGRNPIIASLVPMLLMLLTQACSKGFQISDAEALQIQNKEEASFSCDLNTESELAFGQIQHWQVKLNFTLPKDANSNRAAVGRTWLLNMNSSPMI
jgi:hypothetical protein